MKRLLLLFCLFLIISCNNKQEVVYEKKHLIKELWNYNVTPIRLIEETEYNEDFYIIIDEDGVMVASGQEAFKSLTVDVEQNFYNVVYPDGKENSNSYNCSFHYDNDTIVI